MIIVDTVLEKLKKEGNPIRIGMIGAGTMAKGIAHQIIKYTPGIRLIAVANRNINKAEKVITSAGFEAIHVDAADDLDKVSINEKVAVTDDPFLITESDSVDLVVEVTGTIDYAARIVLSAFEQKKHVVLMNAELDATLGPILKVYADKADVIITNSDGDQPGVIMNLYRFVKGIGVRPVVCGNIKGLHDPYRNPTTQKGFARQWKQDPYMVTSFADGTKISFEQTVVANATGMKVAKRGMNGFSMEGKHIEEVLNLYSKKELNNDKGIVDYVVGAVPSPGVFVIGYIDDPVQAHYLNLYKMGSGPFYCFYTPYHLCHFETPNSIARAVIFSDAVSAPLGGPVVEVVSLAKMELKKGEKLDRLGGYCLYGVCENFSNAREENLLPIGLAEGGIMKRNIKKDSVVTFDDVVLPEGSFAIKLWKEQLEHFRND